jgi:hypothetical protein
VKISEYIELGRSFYFYVSSGNWFVVRRRVYRFGLPPDRRDDRVCWTLPLEDDSAHSVADAVEQFMNTDVWLKGVNDGAV